MLGLTGPGTVEDACARGHCEARGVCQQLEVDTWELFMGLRKESREAGPEVG